MDIKQATQLEKLKTSGAQQLQTKSRFQLAKEVWAKEDAAGRRFIKKRHKDGTKERYTGPKEWGDKWMASQNFVLLEIPLSAAACAHEPKNPKQVATLVASTEPEKPIIVDVNKNKVGKSPSGFVPPIVVVDGKHRHTAAHAKGKSSILAWVGEKALASVTASMQRTHTGAAITIRGRQTRLDRAAVLMAMGGAPGSSLGNGSGPGPSLPNMNPSVRADATTQTQRSNGIGPRLAPSKGASKSELQEMQFAKISAAPVRLSKIVTDYKAACSMGYKPKMDAKAAPGWEESVKEMKDKPGIDNPYALSWYLHDQGYHPHGGKKS